MYVLQSVIQVPDEAFCLTSAERSANPMWQRYFLYITLRRCIQEFGFSHHACNVFIYCSTSPPFRKQLTRTIRGLIPCLEKKRLSNSSTFNSHSTMNTTSHSKDTKSSTRLWNRLACTIWKQSLLDINCCMSCKCRPLLNMALLIKCIYRSLYMCFIIQIHCQCEATQVQIQNYYIIIYKMQVSISSNKKYLWGDRKSDTLLC